MVTRILWIVSILCVVAAAQDYIFKATVQDSGKFMGAKCDSKKEKCEAYKKKLCQFIERPLQTLGPKPYSCDVGILSDRSSSNTINVKVTLKLLVEDSAKDSSFSVQYSTFGAVLKQSLIYLHNTPEASVTITEFISSTSEPTIPDKPVVLEISGKLQFNGKPVEANGKYTNEKTCEIGKQLFNLDMGSDLLNVMYKYSPKYIMSPATTKEDGTIKFQLIYPEDFFKNTSIDYKNDFSTKIEWGLRNSASTKKYYLGKDTTVTLKQPDTQTGGAETADITYTEPKTIPFEFTALVKDDGKLNGEKCTGSQNCIEYKQQLCQLVQKPLFCGRVPTSWKSCSVDILSKRQAKEPLQAKITLRVQETPRDMYPISYGPMYGCPTFAGMYKLAFANETQNPTLDVTKFTPPLKPVAIKSEEVDIQIKGTLLRNGEVVKSEKWKDKAEEKAKTDLLELSLQEEILHTFYRFPLRKLKSLTFDTESGGKVIVSLTITYPKTVFEENAIDPGCDLNDMLQWGIRSAKTAKGYSFDVDTVVQNSAAAERSTSFTFKATVKDNGKFQGAECNGASDQCVEYKEKLCVFVRKAFISSEIAAKDVCSIEILSDRTNEKKDLDVRISLQLNMHASKLQFDVKCPTFGGALKEAFNLLYNTPEVQLNITEIETFQLPPVPSQPSDGTANYVVYQVTGSLYQNGNPVDPTKQPPCEVDKQIATLDMGEDLLNVMYKYNKDNITFERSEEAQGSQKFSFKLYYKKTFFDTTTMNPDCDFADKLQWGFRHPVSRDQFYMGEDTIVRRQVNANPKPGPTDVVDIEYNATVNDGGELNGIECDPKTELCTAYKLQFCQLIESPLRCNRVPNQPDTCKVNKLERSKNGESMKATITLKVRTNGDDDIPQITIKRKQCNTFKVLHNLAFNTLYDSPIVDLGIKLSTPPASATFQIDGKLHQNGKPVDKISDAFEVKYQLANLKMPGKLLQAFYKYNNKRKVEFTKPIDEKNFDGSVRFTVSYEKKDLEAIGLDSSCDLSEMLEWGFQHSKDLNEYHLGNDAKVTEQ